MNEYKLVRTCYACPEQYDVFLDDKCIGYLRLRHGFFYAESITDDERYCVYSANTKGDGIFEDDERSYHLIMAVATINKVLHGECEFSYSVTNEC